MPLAEEPKRIWLVREANFPHAKRLKHFEFAKNPNVTPVGTLADLAWVTAGLRSA